MNVVHLNFMCLSCLEEASHKCNVILYMFIFILYLHSGHLKVSKIKNKNSPTIVSPIYLGHFHHCV